ncbi:hypothetical protein [Dyella silvatica]|uniref:hypothetical protein n=1 Tax=Dyella silvatica TaxID=2992128 RepID=UPI0022530219|nr:hypothetical protein [Dyella silvatica]
MTGLIRKILVVCVLVAAFAAPSQAVAAGGRIAFSGAIVEPTCGVGSGPMAAIVAAPVRAASAQSLGRFVCDSGAGRSATAAVQPYALSVVNIASTPWAADRLIGYFANYVKAAGQNQADLQLVTQTYE